MSDQRFRDQVADYVLGALDEAELREFDDRLATDAELRRLVAEHEEALLGLAEAVPSREPPPRLKEAMLTRARAERAPSGGGAVDAPDVGSGSPGRRGGVAPWLLLAASIAGLAWLGLENQDLRTDVDALGQQLADVRASLDGATTELARLDSLGLVLSGPDVRLATLTGDVPPQVRLLWNPTRQVLVVAASDLPALAPERTYQLWGLRGTDDPVSLGIFATGPDGVALVALQQTVAPDFELSAVTEEPAGGSPGPTTTPFLVGAWTATQD